MLRIFLLCWFNLIILCSLKAQDYPRQHIDFDLLVQELFSLQEDDAVSYEDFYETLFLYYQHPIDLNYTNTEELASIFILSRFQIASLFKYIEENGKLLSIYELQAIPGFDLITISQLIPFVQVRDAGLNADSRPLWQRMIGEDNNALILRYERTLQKRRGYLQLDSSSRSKTRYTGSPDKLLLRYRVSHVQDFSFGITAEKDAGEQIKWSPGNRHYGFDFYSAHLQFYKKGKFKAIALGDYQLQIGQGLLLSSGYSVGKGSETITTVSRANLGIRPYSSVLESAFFRGAAVTYTLSHLNITSFYSNKLVDASIKQDFLDSLNTGFYFSGIQTTGFHRTPTELKNRKTIREHIYGLNTNLIQADKGFALGITALGTHFERPLIKAGAPYQRFEFSGKNNFNLGSDYSYTWQNIYMFGETAISKSKGIGTVNGLMANLSNKLELAILFRYYARDFHSFYGNAFGEASRNINETGIYTGIKIRPIPKWELTAYYDRFKFPWLRFRVDAPSYGDEYLVRLHFRPNKLSEFYGQFRGEAKGLNTANNIKSIDYVSQNIKHHYLLYYEVIPLKPITLKTRVQFSSQSQEASKETGYLIAQDVNLNFGKFKLSSRYALFDTDSFDTRQYVYERDVLYAFSIPAFSGKGTRVYTLLQTKLLSDLDLWVKYGFTQFRNQKTIGTGLDTIEGSKRSDIKIQIRYKF